MSGEFGPEVDLALAGVAKRLAREFEGVAPPADVEQHVRSLVVEYKDARITAYVPVLAERRVRTHFRSIARHTRAVTPSGM